jgi:hypothetical protein
VLFDQLADIGVLNWLEFVGLLLVGLVAFLTAFLCFLILLLRVVLRWLFRLRLFVFDLLGNEIEDVLIPDGQSQQRLLELFEAKSHVVLLGNQFILSEALKDVGSHLWVYDDGEIESCDEEAPGVEGELVIVAFISDGEEGVLEKEVE